MKGERENPVAWLEGMFLRPQHLQQQDRYWEGRLRRQLHALDPFDWGVSALELDEEALSDQRIEVLRLEAVLPGGTLLEYPGGCALEAREFAPDSETVDVWLGLRRPSAGEPQSAAVEEGARGLRYRVCAREVPDLNRVDAEASVDFLVPNARLFLSGEEDELEQHDALRLARVIATGEAKRPFALAREHAPPLLRVQAFRPLEERLEQLASQLAARLRVIAERTSTIAIAELPRMWLRYSIARATPLLRHWLGTGASRPLDGYGLLVELAAALSAFALREPLELPAYDHADPYPCFAALLRCIEQQLEAAIPHRFRELEMRFERGVYATRELGVELADPRNHFFLGIRAALDSVELGALLSESGKCAAREELATILMMNLKGLRLERLPAAPAEIAARVGFEYWKLEPHGHLWSRVRSEGTLALSLGRLEEADVRLYVVAAEPRP